MKFYQNLFCDHLFLVDSEGKLIYGGFISRIQADSLSKAISQIRREFTWPWENWMCGEPSRLHGQVKTATVIRLGMEVAARSSRDIAITQRRLSAIGFSREW